MAEIRGPLYVAMSATKLTVPATGGTLYDLWNGSPFQTAILHSVRVYGDQVSTVVGLYTTFKLRRTSSPGTGGTVVTLEPLNTASGFLLDPLLTSRTLPTGGAALGVMLGSLVINLDETNTNYASAGSVLGGFMPSQVADAPGLVLNPNEGLAVTCEGASLQGSVWVSVHLTVQSTL